MITKTDHPARHVGPDTAPLLRAYFEINQLKLLLRQGWLSRGVAATQCESVAEHSYGVALLALFLGEAHFPELDMPRVLRMALLHDLGEVYVGDLTPAHGVPEADKKAAERDAVTRVLRGLPGAAGYLDLWVDYAAQRSPEARFIKAVDRLEMALQAGVYACQFGTDPSEFYASAEKLMHDPRLRAAFDAVRAHTRARQGSDTPTDPA